MRRMILVLFGLILAGTVMAQSPMAVRIGPGRTQASPIRKPVYHQHPISPLLFETFDANPGYDLSGWTEVLLGTGPIADEDYTSTVLHGTQSLRIDHAPDDDTYTWHSFASNSRVWVSFRLRLLAFGIASPGSEIFSLRNSAGTCRLAVSIDDEGGMRIQPDCQPGTAIGFPPLLNTTYYVWIEYNKDVGGDIFGSVAYSETPVRPANGSGFYVEATQAYTGDGDVDRIYLGSEKPAHDIEFIMDYVLVDDVVIGDYP